MLLDNLKYLYNYYVIFLNYRLRREQASLKELQQQGVCVLKLLISSRHTGLFGRIILTFESGRQIKELPSHSITVGRY